MIILNLTSRTLIQTNTYNMNKKSTFSSKLLVLVITVLLFSCKKNIDAPVPEPSTPFAIPAATPVSGSITGMVVDESNTPVNGAAVAYGSSTVNTDARGMFSFNNVSLDKYITTVTVTHPGYFKSFRSFSANASRNFVNIKLLQKALSGTVSSSSGGAINLSNGTNITFQANSIVVKSTGAVYSGSVEVFAKYIDPTASDISSVVPGSFMARDGNNLYSLQSTGMVAVDLESPTGEALQLSAGSTAAMNLPIPASLLSKAPTQIDTWSLNEQGIWQKEGIATKNGDHYEMQVTHFSFWNCDVPANAIYLNLHIQDQSGNAIPNMLISLTVPNNNTWWGTTYGTTDSSGNVSGLVPSNVELELSAFPNIYNCNTPVYSQTIGPFASNATLTITATLSTNQTLTINGTATDCNNQPLQNGTAIIYTNTYNYVYAAVVNGNYTGIVTHCTPISSVSVIIIDNTSSQATSGDVTVTGNSVTIPVINVCGGPQSAVFTFGNGGANCAAQGSGTLIVGTPLNGSNIISVVVNVSVPGLYNISTTQSGGFSFSGSGMFTSIGVQTVSLTGSGTPTSVGTFFFELQSAGVTGCTFILDVTNPPVPPAVYDLGPGACSGTTVSGTYIAGVPVAGATSVSFLINVISTGSYLIQTNTVNGITFRDSGNFVSTGPQMVLLYGYGIPINAGGPFTFTPMASNGTVGCTFDLTVAGNGNSAVYTFEGAPGNCTNPVITGTYTPGIALGPINAVMVTVNVTTAGTYSIVTNTTNGFVFGASGTFTTTGVQTVALTGSGTPQSTGTYTFLPGGAGVSGCSFIVTVN